MTSEAIQVADDDGLTTKHLERWYAAMFCHASMPLSTGDAPHYNGKCQQTGKLWTVRAGQVLIGRVVSLLVSR